MTATMEPFRLGAAQAAARLADGSLTSEALVTSCLARIAARDRQVKAWVWLDAAAALRAARACDAWAGPRGPLHGLPIGIKDVLDTADIPTAYGSPIYAGWQPAWDAACVARLRAAGAIILGKTATAEFASVYPPATTNPHNAGHTPGGSSSGSAAAVADFMVPLALGTQTAGSTIRPAAFCGITGYKPSFGLIARAGLKLSAESLDTIGLFGRSVADVALLMQALSGLAPPALPLALSATVRIGLYRPAAWPDAEPAAREVFDTAAARLLQAGVAVSECSGQLDDVMLDRTHNEVMGFETVQSLAYEWHTHRDGLSAMQIGRIEHALRVDVTTYLMAQHRVRTARCAFDALMRDHDVLLTLSAAGEAPAGLGSTGNSLFNRAWTLLGAPCVHIPCGRGPHGLPLGIQVVGRVGADAATLSCAAAIAALVGAGHTAPH